MNAHTRRWAPSFLAWVLVSAAFLAVVATLLVWGNCNSLIDVTLYAVAFFGCWVSASLAVDIFKSRPRRQVYAKLNWRDWQ